MRTLSSPLGNESPLRITPPIVRPLILVADDDEDTRVMFRTMLQLHGYRVIEAPDGEKTVQMAEGARRILECHDRRRTESAQEVEESHRRRHRSEGMTT